MTATNNIEYDAETRQLFCRGDWNLVTLPELQSFLNHLKLPQSGDIKVDGGGVTAMDTAGAWLLNTWQEKLTQQGVTVTVQGFPDRCATLLALVEKRLDQISHDPLPPPVRFVVKVGKVTVEQLRGFYEYLSFVGLLALESLRLLMRPSRMRWSSLASVVYQTGFAAIPIIALLSFMIGVVITYQMGLQLKNYGANIFIVDLLGLAILREFGPLITAIMVAGRSGSAFTAQLGMMKLNQEIDALDTMGVTPSELLLLPRILGLAIALPLLTVWADILGVFGGMVMSNNMLGITWYDFLHRFPSVIPLRALLIGLGKAPVFALIIASVGCFQGMKVRGGADSVGTNTTRSVVLAIFFIIVADAIFSIIFSELKL
jgi:phospholipid/cholesterol/gamma-HCH transport system permease protein